jgi:hypothetical protein
MMYRYLAKPFNDGVYVEKLSTPKFFESTPVFHYLVRYWYPPVYKHFIKDTKSSQMICF